MFVTRRQSIQQTCKHYVMHIREPQEAGPDMLPSVIHPSTPPPLSSDSKARDGTHHHPGGRSFFLLPVCLSGDGREAGAGGMQPSFPRR